jgi:hypothetical protein
MIQLADPERRIRALGTAPWPDDRVLIIREQSQADVPSALLETAPDNTHWVTVDSDNLSLRRALLSAITKNTWLVVDIKADLSPDSVTALKEISHGGLRESDDAYRELPPEFRFVAVIERSTIEKQSYPNFLNLFDTAISIS